jgi:hypothetical protein
LQAKAHIGPFGKEISLYLQTKLECCATGCNPEFCNAAIHAAARHAAGADSRHVSDTGNNVHYLGFDHFQTWLLSTQKFDLKIYIFINVLPDITLKRATPNAPSAAKPCAGPSRRLIPGPEEQPAAAKTAKTSAKPKRNSTVFAACADDAHPFIGATVPSPATLKSMSDHLIALTG